MFASVETPAVRWAMQINNHQSVGKLNLSNFGQHMLKQSRLRVRSLYIIYEVCFKPKCFEHAYASLSGNISENRFHFLCRDFHPETDSCTCCSSYCVRNSYSKGFYTVNNPSLFVCCTASRFTLVFGVIAHRVTWAKSRCAQSILTDFQRNRNDRKVRAKISELSVFPFCFSILSITFIGSNTHFIHKLLRTSCH